MHPERHLIGRLLRNKLPTWIIGPMMSFLSCTCAKLGLVCFVAKPLQQRVEATMLNTRLQFIIRGPQNMRSKCGLHLLFFVCHQDSSLMCSQERLAREVTRNKSTQYIINEME